MTKVSNYDVIIIGAGSVGVPTALFLAEKKVKVLVLDKTPSIGQGQNKRAIGGVRKTHSDPTKIQICDRSLQVFSTWHERYGFNIGWKTGGYCFPVFTAEHEKMMKDLLVIQKKFGLDIDWHSPDVIKKLVPGINSEDLRGGVYSPGDGQASPLMAVVAMKQRAEELGAKFLYKEQVIDIMLEGEKVKGVKTTKGTFLAPVVVNASGADAREVGNLSGLDLPVYPDSHEAGVTAPMAQFLKPLVVDLRHGPDGRSSNFYFGQEHHGQIIFCYTPKPLIEGTDINVTSEFLPRAAKRMIQLIPRLQNVLIRRVWRGLYPMTPDGSPIVDQVEHIKGMYLAVGMCGQGFMLGPGIGANLASLIVSGKPEISQDLWKSFSFKRDFSGQSGGEKLK